tara:strand:- start:796 stop:1050 length:255 start_codon:yes stop_codon:yes gene_type:complete
MKDKTQLVIPSWLTRGLTQESKERVEAGYKDAVWLLKRIRNHYEEELESLYKDADELLTHEEYIYGAAHRKALRELLRAFPSDN